MNEWMSEWKNRFMVEQMDRWTDYGQMNRLINGW